MQHKAYIVAIPTAWQIWIGVGRPLELDIKCTETGHCKRTFGIRHSMEFGIRPLEIGIMNSVK